MLIRGLNAYHGDRRNGFAESSLGSGSQARRSDTVLMKLPYRSATSISSFVNSNPRASLLKKIGFTVREYPHLRFVLD